MSASRRILLKKSIWGDARKFLRPADRLYVRRREGPYCLPKSITSLGNVADKRCSSREAPRSTFARFFALLDFRFFNNMCQEETYAPQQVISLYERTCRRNKKRIQRQDWQKKSAVGLRAATAFLYAPTRPRLSPHGGRNSQRARQLSTPSTRWHSRLRNSSTRRSR